MATAAHLFALAVMGAAKMNAWNNILQKERKVESMKKTISILLAVALLAVCLAVPITAANHPFTDVSDNAWYAGNVEFVYEKGLMSGTDTNQFSPEMKMNRAMLVTVLYRMDGSKEASGTTPFTDVKTGEYYYPALVWAYGNGIINGTAPDKFSPEAPITREMMVTIFYRYAQFKGLDVSKTDSLSKYTDAVKISNYAKTPFAWAVAAGVIFGNSATTLNPLGTATRAECAAILQRFYGLTQSSTDPTEPTNPTEPTEPTEPSADYSEPVDPSEGETPTEPTQPSDPCPDNPEEPTEHVHCWTCVDVPEEGHWVGAVQCTCGAYFEDANGVSAMDQWVSHVESFSGRDQLTHFDCYSCSYYVVDKPATRYWWCPSCNTSSDTNPNP